MAVSRYFGLPGAGKTTVLAYLAYNGLRSGKYRDVYSNVHLNIPGVTYIDFSVLGTYHLENALILIDEAMVECGDRDYKSFSKALLKLFVMHRHYRLDIVLMSQEADGVDKKIRSISERMYWVKKGWLLGHWVTTVYRIPYKILWPDGENNGSDNVGRIMMGYVKPPLLSRLFARRIWRPKYYPMYDSWVREQLQPLPGKYEKIPGTIVPERPIREWFSKSSILLRSVDPNIA